LLPFYIIAPLIYLVFHFYLLMMLVLLARTAAEFEDELRKTLSDNAQQERYRARVENALFLQLLVGMKSERVGFNGWLLATIAIITIAMAPVATLILMQTMFLPYHNLQITWWHRTLILADLVLIFVMWRTYFSYSSVELPRATLSESSSYSSVELSGLTRTISTSYSLHLMTGHVAQIVLVAFALWLAFWEGRWAGEPWIGRRDFASTANGVAFGLFPDRLKLPNEPVVGKDRLEEIQKEITSRGGEFVPTRKFEGRDLQAADLRGADLRGVGLGFANLRGARLSNARLDTARLLCAPNGACTHLEGADLTFAQLQGAFLSRARLQGADLLGAYLYGAYLGGAQLQGARLRQAHLQGAHLSAAHLEGADLDVAQLEGANLGSASLQGADLAGADLQGAGLSFAQLQGADLTGARMADTEFDGAYVFGTKIDDADLLASAISDVRANAVKKGARVKLEPLTR
jgi:uncharacterized protein YjbI with pentapeptide repeats